MKFTFYQLFILQILQTSKTIKDAEKEFNDNNLVPAPSIARQIIDRLRNKKLVQKVGKLDIGPYERGVNLYCTTPAGLVILERAKKLLQ